MKKYFFPISLLIITTSIAQPVLDLQNRRSLSILDDRKFTTHNSTTRYLSSLQDNDIIGSWTLLLQSFDKNSNGKLDEEERKLGNTGRHFYQFNADGTCLIHTMKLKGYYEFKNEGSKRRLYTYVYDEGKPVRENAWYIISVSKTELVLLSQDKYAFWIYKRV